jgi:hypothetical protein
MVRNIGCLLSRCASSIDAGGAANECRTAHIR